MIYFVSSTNPINTRSGLEKRCNLWWHYWHQQGQTVQWVELSGRKPWFNIVERVLLKVIPAKLLPYSVLLYRFFEWPSVLTMLRHNATLSRVLRQSETRDDTVFIFRAYTLHYLSARRFAKLLRASGTLIVDFDESDYRSRNTFMATNAAWLTLKNEVFEREKRLLAARSVQIYVSGENEIDGFRKLYAIERPVSVMPNKLTINPPFMLRKLTQPVHCLLIGTFAYRPNAEMLEVLLEELLPTLTSRSELQFHVVGGGLPTLLKKQLTAYTNVHCYGFVEDTPLEQMYRNVHFMLAPLKSGGGIKYKIVESLAYGLPIVATPKALEGFDLQPQQHYLPYQASTFESDVAALLGQPALYENMSRQGYEHYQQLYYFPTNNRNSDQDLNEHDNGNYCIPKPQGIPTGSVGVVDEPDLSAL